jgi:hypothetical protein
MDDSSQDGDISIKIPSSADRENMEKCLFCKKIKLEGIDDTTLEYSKDCFFMSDIATRMLRKKGYPERVIQEILTLSYMEYQRIKSDTYRTTNNSQLFIDTVHEILQEYDFSELLKQNKDMLKLYNFQKTGFIHILADDRNKDIWWGRQRL